MAASLYIVATPIGNLADITKRAVDTLSSVDAILCEDTRVTLKLLSSLGIKKSLVSYHQHSDAKKSNEILQMLADGKHLALVTDAGTPAISDPGGRLVEEVVKKLPEVLIIPIPGASAVIAALSISGFPTDEFLFLGFPPHKKGRQSFFDRITKTASTVVFYESTHRIEKAIAELVERIADRQIVVCRELTKMFETTYRGTAKEVTEQMKNGSLKGEFVVILAPL